MRKITYTILAGLVLFALVVTSVCAGGDSGIIKRKAYWPENGDQIWYVPTGRTNILGNLIRTKVSVYLPDFLDWKWVGVWNLCWSSVRAKTESQLEQALLTRIHK